MKIRFDDTDNLLIWLYIFIDGLFKQTELSLYTMRLSNNNRPHFTDAELFSCAIFAELMGCKSKKDGYGYLRRHYLSWFPRLPGYEVYNRKLNQFHEALTYIFKMLRNRYAYSSEPIAQVDTAPITVCQAQHAANSKTAQTLVSLGFCAAKKQYYIGVKLQIISQHRKGLLPVPLDYHIDTASTHDLIIGKDTIPYSDLKNIALYSDKAYIDKNFQLDLFEINGIKLITPIKKHKGQKHLTLFQRAFNAIHSSIRQPIDTLFGWINKQTNIENASKVRNIAGLFYHINVKMVAALIMLIFKF